MPKHRETIPACTFFDLVLWLLRRRSRLRVVGRSMWPVLQPGDEVLVKPLARSSPKHRSLCVGDIVTLWHPTQPGLKIVKRIAQIDQTLGQAGDRYFVRGDNPEESTDSRQFGWIKGDLILGKVVCRFDLD
ncbi:MAG: nickel-type superoxide dismutase maturation protease [Oscillatoriales cyanobacterium]|nr:MAG: nickel-type superoxide dismutase maturation protease [Oscillatoriales cyanobacterium]